ncbi:DUF5707 domain-containing protein [Streptomyces sp. NPDC052687]|uniref:DUF5707 domain-containing protein n=1 Tax=Streptomyces sp. NPDC052687 TaxID=3154759 RepID=UPI003420D019
MRIRATVAAVTGALALSALAVPAAQAAGGSAADDDYRADVARIARAATDRAAGQPYDLNVSFSGFKVAKAVKVGTTQHVSTTVSYTLTHDADVNVKSGDFLSAPVLYRGTMQAPTSVPLMGNKPATCTATSATTATCTGKIDIYPGQDDLLNSDAGTWKGGALAVDFNGQDPDGFDFDITKVGYAEQGGLGTTLIQRNSTLTVDATPEPVQKGKTLTITGKLARANWETHKYAGYTNQPVKLQFRKDGTTTYTDVKTIKTDSTGNLKTTVKAGVDGYYRYSFAGTSTTPAVNAKGDFVDVQ